MVCVASYLTYRTWQAKGALEVYTRYTTGSHLLMVVAAPFEQTPNLAHIVMTGIDSASAVAERSGVPFGTIGVSADWRVERGMQMLRSLGSFDEMIVGRNWLNHGVAMYMTEFGVRPKLPQIALFTRPIEIADTVISYGPLRELLRLEGMDAIENWAASGYQLPMPVAATPGATGNRAEAANESL
jgi:hypothetical protein